MADGTVSRIRRPSWKAALDVLASLAMIGAALFLVVSNLSNRAASSRPELKIPKEPVSIEGTPTKGSSTAPVVMVTFADFQCPYCGRFAREVLPQLEKDYISTGRVQLVYRHLPLGIHPRAAPAAHAAECAAVQGQFWPMHDWLFAEGAQLDDAGLRTAAGSVGIDLGEFETCLDEPKVRELVSRDAERAKALGLRGTPSFLLGSRLPDGRVHVSRAFSGALPLEDFRTELDREIASKAGAWFGKLFLLATPAVRVSAVTEVPSHSSRDRVLPQKSRYVAR
jgi:protein-disulfide isomerase